MPLTRRAALSVVSRLHAARAAPPPRCPFTAAPRRYASYCATIFTLPLPLIFAMPLRPCRRDAVFRFCFQRHAPRLPLSAAAAIDRQAPYSRRARWRHA